MSRGKNDKLFDIFVGENVIITIDTMTSVTHTSEHGTIIEAYPIEYNGTLLDVDEENFYLGDLLTGVQQAIPKARRINIELDNGMKVVQKVFDQMPVPEKDEDVN